MTTLTATQARALNRLDSAKGSLKMTAAMFQLCQLGLAVKVVTTKMSGRGGFPSVDKQLKCLISDSGCGVIRTLNLPQNCP